MNRGEVDFSAVLRGKCPLCAGRGCIRELTAYGRGFKELFPLSSGRVLVARFECVTLKAKDGRRHTFSLLPLELVPYRRYTLRSMLTALALFVSVFGPDVTTIEQAFLDALPTDGPVSVSLLRLWAQAAVRGFRRSHPVLCKMHELSLVSARSGLVGEAGEVREYLRGCRVRAPPAFDSVVCTWTEDPAGWHDDLCRLVTEYSRATRVFLVGVPSQERG